MTMLYDHAGEPVYLGRYVATVVDNADPNGLGRIRFRIEGMIEPQSGWAYPVGGSPSSGAAQRGSFDVPTKGATVLASFLAGDVDQPIYEGAWHGTGEALTQTPDPVNADKVKIFETSRWLIVLNSIGGSEKLVLLDKGSNNVIELSPNGIKALAPSVVIGDENAAQSSLLAQTYRSAESTANTTLIAQFQAAAAAAVTNPSTEPACASLGTIFAAMASALQSMESGASGFLSTQVKNS